MNAPPTPPPSRIEVPRRVAVPLVGIVLLLGIVFRPDDPEGDRDHFVSWQTPRAVQNLPDSRVWVPSFPGVALPEELRDTLAGYQPSVKVEARRVKAGLYVPPPAHSRPPEAFPPTPAARR